MAEFHDETSFIFAAAKHYDNPSCKDFHEFLEDLKRVTYVKKLLNRYEQDGQLRERLILNHIVVLYNCFGSFATQIIFWRLAEYASHVVPFLKYLSLLPEMIHLDNKLVRSSDIVVDENVERILRNL